MPTDCCSLEAPATAGPAHAKFHTALNVTDLARSVEFYRLLFGLAPAKQRADYAKFELEEPPLVLTLMPGRPAAGGILNHFGLRVTNTETLVEMQRRLEVGGIRTRREEGVECCYARQTKFWATDPDQAFWEIYVVHEDLDEAGDDHIPTAEQVNQTAGESTATRVVWHHHIGEPVPAHIPHDDHAVHEVFLEGTANLLAAHANLAALLAEAFRVLRPGGEVRIHGLSGDHPLTEPLPALPGPAAVVEHVPAHAEVVHALHRAGFTGLHLEKLSSTAHFTVGRVPLRELVLSGRKLGHRPSTATRAAIYLGPLASVTDDFGNTFRRGEVTALNVHDWQVLSQGPAAAAFLFP